MERSICHQQARVAVCAAALLASAVSLSAQSAEPEVRRALPVDRPASEPTPVPVRRAEPVDPANYQNPAWMSRLPESRAPEPAGTPLPVATPIPIATPIPVATPAPTPAEVTRPSIPRPSSPAPGLPASEPPASRPASEPAADEDGTIRLAPQTGVAETQRPASLLAGDGFYSRKMYDFAAVEYEKFLISYPQAPGRDQAMFRLAESHRFLGNDRAARSGYERLLAEFREGDYVSSGAYRLAEILFGEQAYGRALLMFRKAAEQTKEEAVRLSAKYYEANCLDLMGKGSESVAIYRELASIEKDNPYREPALFKVAAADAAAGRKEEALAKFEKLSESAEKPERRAEAMVKAAALATELGNTERAKALFEKALTSPGVEEWRGVAQLGVIRLAYEAGDYEKVVSATQKGLDSLPQESVPEALLLGANARRQLGQHREALERYDRIMREFPRSKAAESARFHRLVCLSAVGDPNVVKEIDEFLAMSTSPEDRNQARLLKAETLLAAGNFADAAGLYGKVLEGRLPERFKEQALYKQGWAYARAGDSASAIQALGKFLEAYPKSALAPSALAYRGLAHQQNKAYDAALQDFNRLIEGAPKAKERELALQQKALILGQQDKPAEMAAAFRQLLEEYPKTAAAGQAHFWIGKTALDGEDFDTAIREFEQARETGAPEFSEKAAQRIIYAYYRKDDSEAVAREVEKINATSVPSDISVWLGQKYFEKGEFAKAEKFLEPLVQRDASIPVSPDLLINLAQAQLSQGKYGQAQTTINRYMQTARDPISRAKGLLASGEASLGAKNYGEALKFAEEAMLLQPEGRLNASGRLLLGQVELAQGQYDEAARAFLTLAVLYDDPTVTPRALQLAAEAYQKLGNMQEAEKAIAELKRRYPDFAVERRRTGARN